MADDIAALIDHLGWTARRGRLLARRRGGAAGRVAHPEKVGRLVVGVGEHPPRRDLPGDARRSRLR
jgi:hypothetical protein